MSVLQKFIESGINFKKSKLVQNFYESYEGYLKNQESAYCDTVHAFCSFA